LTIAEKIKAKALELGFSKAGIARCEPLDDEGARLSEWLHRGFHGSMGWMQRGIEKRIDPQRIVPGAQTVISVALNYYTPTRHRDDAGIGKISRYAWGDDYHEIMGKKLRTLWDWLADEFPGIEGRYYVDTGPVMEKVWAQKAGLGWIGKHTNLISQDFGSWLFLGEIITTLQAEPDTAETDHCGSCRLCLDACPTKAIVQPFVVDSNRCISYLTIEHRGPIEAQYADQLDGWIYGCDICQDVCPWNEKFSTPTSDPGFEPRDWNRAPMLGEWEEMNEEEFRFRFKGSAMKRTKREGLQRNVKAALTGH
jgi:epoxyqueuosine reductase